MSKKTDKPEDAVTEAMPLLETPAAPKKASAPVEVVDAAPASDPEPMITFDRWFAITGRPDHWKHGMRAYARTGGRKTPSEWSRIFAKY